MPTIVGPANEPAIRTQSGAHHYRFIGIRIRPAGGTFSTGLITLGGGETSAGNLPHDIIFDRCYIHGDPTQGGKRGVAVNANRIAIIDSHLSDWKGRGMDTQAIAGWNGAGPLKIVNNYIEGAGENVMFGGADPSIPNLVPSDIEFRRNLVRKNPTWNQHDSSKFAGVSWTVKNLFELKNARRVLIDGNTFEYHWPDAQSGWAIVLTVRNQDGTAPWSTVEDVIYTNNILRHVSAGINILGNDDLASSQTTNRFLIKNNIFEDIGAGAYAGRGIMLQVLNGARNVTFDHNTSLQTGSTAMADSAPNPGFVFTNNIALSGQYGFTGSGTSAGNLTLNTYYPGAVFSKNAIIGGNGSTYPANNFFPATVGSVGFTDASNSNYALTASSPYKNAGTDGKDLGVDMAALTAAQAKDDDDQTTPPDPPGGGSGGSGPVTASFSNPAAGATVTGTTTVSVGATGGSGNYTFQVSVGGSSIYTGSNTTFSWNTANTANGQKQLTVTATDSSSVSGTATRMVNVSNTTTTPPSTDPPGGGSGGGTGGDAGALTVSITAPASGVWTGDGLTIRASASHDVAVAKIELWAGGKAFQTLTCGGKTCAVAGWWNSTGWANAAYEVAAVAYDNTGKKKASAPVTIYKDAKTPLVASGASSSSGGSGGGTTPPPLTVAFTSPADGATVNGSVVVGMSVGGASGSTTLKVLVDGSQISSQTVTGGSASQTIDTTTLTNGDHAIGVSATDGSRTASASMTLKVANTSTDPGPGGGDGGGSGGGTGDTVPPTVTFNSPTSPAWTSDVLRIRITATDNERVVKVEFWVNGKVFATPPCTGKSCSATAWWISSGLPFAAYEVRAVAYDAAGNRTVSAPLIVYREARTPLVPAGVASSSLGGLTPVASSIDGLGIGRAVTIAAAGSTAEAVTEIRLRAHDAVFAPTRRAGAARAARAASTLSA